jgi:hypothetical protein
MAKAPKKASAIELYADAWPRFEQFVRDVAKAGPQHRTTKAKSKAGQESPAKKQTKARIGEERSRPNLKHWA